MIIKRKVKKDYMSIMYVVSSLESYLSAGINFMRALELIQRGLKNKEYANSVSRIAKRINEGETIASAFIEEEEFYTTTFIDMLAVAEESGEIEKVLNAIKKHFSRKIKLETQIRNALMYPKFICLAISIMILFFIDFILPSIVSMYESLSVEASFFTRTIIELDIFFSRVNVYVFSIVVIFFIFLIYKIIKYYTKGKDLIAFLELRKRYKEIRLIELLNLILDSGVPVVYALERLSHSISDLYMTEYINTVLIQIRSGNDLYDSIDKVHVMSDVSKSFILSGEQSGSLDRVIRSLLKILNENFEKALKKCVSKVEPLSICFLGILVLGVMLMVFIPMYEYMHYV
ncbi:MAG: type II secretion system F family protein [Sarcina sp.]